MVDPASTKALLGLCCCSLDWKHRSGISLEAHAKWYIQVDPQTRDRQARRDLVARGGLCAGPVSVRKKGDKMMR